jgi:cytochrome c oxidase assembly protein subunit 15
MKEKMTEIRHSQGRTFRKFGVITIVAVYLLILIGGIVRSTGSGMGCPDWPKCFGSWVPPTEVSQLPADYQEVYAQKRKAKNDRLAATLARLNFTSLAQVIAGDASIYKEAVFNPVKTWIEYVNRLIGVLIGLFIFITAFLSFRYRKTDPIITALSITALILVGFEGWLGSIVVSTNLLPGTITVHMLLAIIIVCLLIYVLARSYDGMVPFRAPVKKPQVNFLLTLTLLFSVAQVVLGTQVREEIDSVSSVMSGAGRETWIDKLGIEFYIHRSFSILVLLVNLRLIWLLGAEGKAKGMLGFLLTSLIAVVITSIASGAALAYFAIPAVLQPVHLLLASLLAGIQFALLLYINQKKVLSSSRAESTSKQYLYQ